MTKVLDREFIDTYNVSYSSRWEAVKTENKRIVVPISVAVGLLFQLSGIARYANGTMAERGIDLRIKVVDENDNPPVFQTMAPVVVNELCAVGKS